MAIDQPAKRSIANKLRQLREQKGYTQAQIGKMMGKATTTVASWENSKGQPDADTFLRLCVLYEVDSVLEAFGYREVTGSISSDERELIRQYRKLAGAQKQLIVQLAKGMADMEVAEELQPPLVAVARGKGEGTAFSKEKLRPISDMPDSGWKGEE